MYRNLKNMDPQRVATAALQGFFSISESWGLTAKQQQIMLGEPAESTFFKWKSTKSAKQLDENTLLRISYILGIFKALRIMHVEENQRHFLTNVALTVPFNGRSPLDFMLSGDLADLARVRRYLDGQLQVPYT